VFTSFECECGNPDCHAEVDIRTGIYYKGGVKKTDGFFIDAYDMQGTSVELMLHRALAWTLMWALMSELFHIRRSYQNLVLVFEYIKDMILFVPYVILRKFKEYHER